MSRYTSGGIIYKINERDSFWERIEIPKTSSDTTIVLDTRYDGAPDLLAFDLYGDSSLEWILLQFNSIQDVTEEFVAGKLIRIPSMDTIRGLK